jgi:hypothetical protein
MTHSHVNVVAGGSRDCIGLALIITVTITNGKCGYYIILVDCRGELRVSLKAL